MEVVLGGYAYFSEMTPQPTGGYHAARCEGFSGPNDAIAIRFASGAPIEELPLRDTPFRVGSE